MKTWLVGTILALLAVGVVLARESDRPRGTEPTLVPSATQTPVAGRVVERATQPVAAAAPTRAPAPPTPVAAGRATSAPARPAATPTEHPASAATPTAHLVTAAPTEVKATSVPAAPTATSAPPHATSAPAAAPVAGTAGWVDLTFDAGADRGYAEDILDLLQAEHVVASFGMTGQWARANPELVRRMAADGHMVFNHTVDHRSFTGVSDSQGGLSAAKRRAELTDADALIAPLIGHSTKPYYRLPYGDDDKNVVADVEPAGYTQKVGWTVDSMGWRGLAASDIVARCLSMAKPGAIYVFHVGRQSQDAMALERIVRGLRERGFGFRRVDAS